MADSAFIDTLEVMDFDYITIGPDAVIGEGSIVTCHTFKDGFITFDKVSLGDELSAAHECKRAFGLSLAQLVMQDIRHCTAPQACEHMGSCSGKLHVPTQIAVRT